MTQKSDRAEQAIDYIIGCCSTIGRFSNFDSPGNESLFLREIATEIAESENSIVFPGRYREHVACALDMVASHGFTSSYAAIASVYLATRFEFYFRVLSDKLNEDGSWRSKIDKNNAIEALGSVINKRSNRVSSVGVAYKVMKLNRSSRFAKSCTRLDAAIYPEPYSLAGGETIREITSPQK